MQAGALHTEQCGTGLRSNVIAWIVGFLPLDGEVELAHHQKKSENDTTLVDSSATCIHATDFFWGMWEVMDEHKQGKVLHGWVPVAGKVGSQMTARINKFS
jgi:hypothetical protein